MKHRPPVIGSLIGERLYTFAQVEKVLREHAPVATYDEDSGPDHFCTCSYTAGTWPEHPDYPGSATSKFVHVDWNHPHFLDELRKAE